MKKRIAAVIAGATLAVALAVPVSADPPVRYVCLVAEVHHGEDFGIELAEFNRIPKDKLNKNHSVLSCAVRHEEWRSDPHDG